MLFVLKDLLKLFFSVIVVCLIGISVFYGLFHLCKKIRGNPEEESVEFVSENFELYSVVNKDGRELFQFRPTKSYFENEIQYFMCADVIIYQNNGNVHWKSPDASEDEGSIKDSSIVLSPLN